MSEEIVFEGVWKEIAKLVIKEKSLLFGEYQLASGVRSGQYFNMKPSMLDAKGSYAISMFMLMQIRDSTATAVGGLELGAVPLIGSIVSHSYFIGSPCAGLIVRKSPKEHGTRNLIEGLPENETLTGRRIAVVEDVTSTGGSAMKAVSAFRDAGAEIVLLLSVLDREMGASDLFKTEGIPFKPLFLASEFDKAQR